MQKQQPFSGPPMSYEKIPSIENTWFLSTFYSGLQWPRYQRLISLDTHLGITSQMNKWTNMDPRTYRGGIRCLRGISISCRPVTPAVGRVPLSWMQSYPLSETVCQVRSNYWYEKCQRTYGSVKVCNHKLDQCNGHRAWETPTSNETIEIPVTSTCQSVVYPDSKTDCI
jgi:hypothetical protein